MSRARALGFAALALLLLPAGARWLDPFTREAAAVAAAPVDGPRSDPRPSPDSPRDPRFAAAAGPSAAPRALETLAREPVAAQDHGLVRSDSSRAVHGGRLRVLDTAGAPLVGARLTWHRGDPEVQAFAPDALENRALWALEARTRALSDRRLEFYSDREGWVAGAPLTPGSALEPDTEITEFGWLTHPGHRAQCLHRDEHGAWPSAVWLSASSDAWALIQNAGQPAPGARLCVQALLPSGMGLDSLPVEALERRALYREAIADPSGRARLPDLAGRCIVWAEADGLRSLPVELELPGALTLELRPSLLWSGRVHSLDGSPLDPNALVTLEAIEAGDDPIEGLWLASATLAAGGVFGPLEVPRLEGTQGYRVRLFGQGMAAAERRLDAPGGASLVVELGFTRGAALAVFPIALESGAALPGTRLVMRPSGESDQAQDQAVGRIADGDGLALISGLRPDQPYDLIAQSPGRAPRTLAGLVLPGEGGPAVLDLELARAQRLRGRVLVDGRPAREFAIHRGTEVLGRFERIAFHDRTEGDFELDDLAPGPLPIFAELPGLGLTPPLRLELGEAQNAPIVLELESGAVGSGRLVDARRGTGIPGARFELLSGPAERPRARLELFPVVDSSGGFRIPRLHREAAALAISAPGYRPVVVEGRWIGAPGDSQDAAAEGGPVGFEFGSVELEPLGVLTIQLVGAADPRAYRVALGSTWGGPGGVSPSVAFGADGRAELELGLAAEELTLRHPGGVEDVYALELDGPGPFDLELFTDEAASLTLALIPTASTNPGATAGAARVDVWAKFTDPLGRRGLRGLTLSTRGMALPMPGLPASVLDLEWVSPEGVPGLLRAALDRSPNQRIELPLELPARFLRVLDDHRRPIVGATLDAYLRSDAAEPKHLFDARSDAAGLCPVPAALGGELYLTLRTHSGFVLPDFQLGGEEFHPDAGSDDLRLVAEWVLPRGQSIALLVHDDRGPLQGACVEWSCLAGSLFLTASSTDREGRTASTPLGQGAYRVLLSAPGHAGLRLEVQLPGGASLATRQLRLPCLSPLEVWLQGPDGMPLANQAFRLEPADLSPDLALLPGTAEAGTTDARGHARLNDVPCGPLRLWLGDRASEFELEPREDGSVPARRITLERP